MKLVEFRIFVDVDGGEHLQTVKQIERAPGAGDIIKGVAVLLTELRKNLGVFEVGPCEQRIGYQLVPIERVVSVSVEIISVADADGPEERLNAAKAVLDREFEKNLIPEWMND